MKKITSYPKYSDYLKDCIRFGIEPISRNLWNYECMKDTYDN